MTSQQTVSSVTSNDDVNPDVDMSESQISETQQTTMTVDSTSITPPATARHRHEDKEADKTAWLGSFWQVERWESDHLKQLELVADQGYTKETQWPILQTLLKNRIKQNLASFLTTSFPRAAAAGSSSSSSTRRARSGKKRAEDQDDEEGEESRVLAPATQHPGNMEGGSMDSFAMGMDLEDEVRGVYSTDDEDDEDEVEGDGVEEKGGRSGPTRRKGKKKTYGPEDLIPSTQGGLVIPPFPPLRSRDREPTHGHGQDQEQDQSSSSGSSSTPGSSRSFGMSSGGGRPPLGPRSNSGPYQPPLHTPLSPGFASASGAGGGGGGGPGMGDPTYDREAAIGGKVLGGKVRPREAEGLLEGIWRLVDEFERDPPFTVQRLCELAAYPRRQHTLLGKYVRALERVLLVTSSFEFPAEGDDADADDQRGDSGVSGVQPGTDRPGVPPGLALERPLFGLIPFLQPQDGEMAVMPGTSAAAAVGGGSGGLGSGGVMDTPPIDSSSSVSAPVPSELNPSEPFLGRVDELDAGPLIKPSPDPTNSGGPSSQDPHQLHDVKEGGAGVILHGVSDRPRAISSTTDLSGLGGAGMYRDGRANGKNESDDEGDVGGNHVDEDDQQPRLDGHTSDSSSTSSVFSTTSTRSGNTRRISKLPRTSSSQSLTDRFVSTGMEVLDPAKEEQVRLGGEGERGGMGGRPDAAHGIKVDKVDEVELGEKGDGREVKGEGKEEEVGVSGLPVKIRRVE